ncbi:aquaporin [Nocardioides houyundeii]|uniref:aquaporin n=1 Tax=Nocardioides houyundeii TaxID=2045452 RepID=UPI000C764EC1|nr:aquaporin [Nocardioides houyundeii]
MTGENIGPAPATTDQPTDGQPTPGQKVAAELIGTYVLVFFGCGAAMMSQGNYVATALAFGLALLVMAAAVGRISGGHFNPAVTLAAALGGRLAWRETPVYMCAQLVGGLLAGASLLGIMMGFPNYDFGDGLGQNFFGDQSPGGFEWWAALLLEALLTMIFVWVILGVTDARNSALAGLAPLAIGFALAMIHLTSIGATGTSVNPARSIGVGVFAGGDAAMQLWLFVVAPLLGGAIGGATYALLFGQGGQPVPGSGLKRSPRPQQPAYPGYGQSGPGSSWGGVAGQPHPGQAYPPQQPGQPGQPGQSGQSAQWGTPGAPQWGAPGDQGQPPAAPTQTRQPQPGAGAPPQWGQPAQPGWGLPDDDDGRTQIRPGG